MELEELASADLSGIDTSKTERMANTFAKCSSLESIDGLSG